MPAVSDDATPGAAAVAASASGAVWPVGTLLPGPQIFGDYELLSEIARGGMGVVYRARHIKLDRLVALKLILAGEFAGKAEIKRFRAEAEAVANLDHPHIVSVYEVGECEGRHFFSMKLIEGRSLAEGRPADALSVDDRVRLVLKVAEAIHYAHQRGVLHRDLKPANILLDRQGEPHVTDFGLARRLGAESRLTLPGTIFGTPAYMPPEQADDARGLTVAADVYSLGAVLYDLLAGRPPFEAPTPMETVMQLRDEDPRPLRVIRPEIAKDLETICQKCLRKDPAQRYASALALAEDLQRYLADEPILARRVGLPERAWRWARRRPAVAALSAAVSLLLLGSLIGGVQFAARLSREIQLKERANRDAQNELWANYLSRAELERLGTEVGRKEFGLHAVQAAAAIRAGPEPVDEAVAQFALFDVSGRSTKHPRSARGMPVTFTPDFATYLVAETNLTLTAHRAVDDAELWRLSAARPRPASGPVSAAADVDRKTSRIEDILVSADGAKAALNFSDERMELLDIISGRSLTNFESMLAVQFSPDSRELLVVDGTRQPQVWDLAAGKPVSEPKPPSHQPGEMHFAPDPALAVLALARFDTVEFWDRKRGAVLSHLKHDREIYCLAWEGDLLAVGDCAGDIRVWNLRTARTQLLKGHRDAVLGLLFTPETRQLISNGRDGRTFCWDPHTGDQILSSEKFHALQVSRDGSRVLYGDEEQWGTSATLLPRGLRRISSAEPKDRRLRQIHFSPDGKLLLAVRQSGLRFFDAASGRFVFSYPLFPAVRAWFLPDGRSLLIS